MTEPKKIELLNLLSNTGISLFRLKNRFFKHASSKTYADAYALFEVAVKALQDMEILIKND